MTLPHTANLTFVVNSPSRVDTLGEFVGAEQVLAFTHGLHTICSSIQLRGATTENLRCGAAQITVRESSAPHDSICVDSAPVRESKTGRSIRDRLDSRLHTSLAFHKQLGTTHVDVVPTGLLEQVMHQGRGGVTTIKNGESGCLQSLIPLRLLGCEHRE
ncbi:uncharacterized protein N7498_000979 [Penicillium cinerascens]|uniref:Uncharacterized protein n=1 Tax=Penicillium cinerascens TaxID=70096 RepID=A0A9W9NFA8_9EURO|nr:uncharacterized protein N7498_000979 [Penicillium cinerascens]KAJ5218880.1 hypothetical protein N7498_000979 [Penicillium cinerascens]